MFDLLLQRGLHVSYHIRRSVRSSDPAAEKHIDPVHDVILFRIVRVFLGRDFQHGRDGSVIVLEDVPDVVGDVLIDQDDSDVVARREVLERLLDLLQFGILLDDQEIRSARRPVSDPRQEETGDGVLVVV